MKKQTFITEEAFALESGESLPELEIAYHTAGTLNSKQNNVIWICHALTANSDPSDWWYKLVGKGKLYDPDKHFIICANVIGSCYGSSGPGTINPDSGQAYLSDFPFVSVRDMVNVHNLLRVYLGITKIHTVIGGSLGGQQALEWSILNPDVFEHAILIATSAVQSPWAIAINEAQRMAIKADPGFQSQDVEGGKEGLRAARAIALLSYRNSKTYNSTQKEEDTSKVDNFPASSYQNYQGEKFIKRFNAHAYYTLSKALDSHHIGRNRASVKKALNGVQAKVLVVSINSDILYPPNEQSFLAKYISKAVYKKVNSRYGHDGFLIEGEKLTAIINKFYSNNNGKEE